MDKIIDYLKQLELSDIEAKLYLALLKTGTTGVRELAKSIDIKRTTAYIYVDLLVEKGLVIKTVKGSRKQVSPIDPKEGLEELVNQRLKSAEETQRQFPNMLKDIGSLGLNTQNIDEAEIRHYKGRGGVKKIYDEVLGAKEQRSYVDMTTIAEVFPENFTRFAGAFEYNPTVKMYEIVENSSSAKEYLKKVVKKKNYFYKILPKGVKLTAQDILIYDNKVAIIYLKGAVSGVVLHNRDLYNNFKVLFDLMWKLLPEVDNE